MLQLTPHLLVVQVWFILVKALLCHRKLDQAHKISKLNQGNRTVPTLEQFQNKALKKKCRLLADVLQKRKPGAKLA